MKNLGIYFSPKLDTILIGFEQEMQYGTRLHGRVIGHTKEWMLGFHAFNVGYTYHQWNEDFIYLGHYTNFTTYQGYMDFMNKASYEELKAYFMVKPELVEYMKTFVIKKQNDGRTYFERHYSHN